MVKTEGRSQRAGLRLASCEPPLLPATQRRGRRRSGDPEQNPALFRSRQDTEDWVVGLQVLGGASTSPQFLNTVSELKQLMDVVEQRGFSFAAVSTPPGTFLPFDITTLAVYFEHELEKPLRLGE